MNTVGKIAGLLVMLSCLFTGTAQAAETSLIKFKLEGHDGKDYTEEAWSGHPLLIFHADRDGSVQNEGRVWSKPVFDLFKDTRVVMLSVADLRAVPALFRGMARDMVQPKPEDPVKPRLFDWKGEFAKRYELPGGTFDILMFDDHGKLVYRNSLSKFDQAVLDSVLAELQLLSPQLQQ